jgi:regulator of replication initiation timing
MKKTKAKNTPLTDNEHIKELFGILEKNGKDASTLTAIINSVSSMERQLNAAVNGIDAIRRELSVMREERGHPIKTLLEKSAKPLSGKIKGILARIKAVKDGIIDGCKRAVSAFKEKGISALNNLAEYFDVKQNLLAERESINACIDQAQNSVGKIEAASEHYHAAGGALKNIVRAIRGEEAVHDIKPNGRLAQLIEAPFLNEIKNLNRSLQNVNKTLASLDRLEKAAAKVSEAGRPSTLENMKALQKEIDAEKRKSPDRNKKRAAEI